MPFPAAGMEEGQRRRKADFQGRGIEFRGSAEKLDGDDLNRVV